MDERQQGDTKQSVSVKKCPVIPNSSWIKGTVFSVHPSDKNPDGAHVVLQLQKTADLQGPNFAASHVGFQIGLQSNVPVELQPYDVIQGVVSFMGDEGASTFVLIEYEKV